MSKVKLIYLASLLGGAMLTLGASVALADHHMSTVPEFWSDSGSSGVVTNGYGECWQGGAQVSGSLPVECGGVVAEAPAPDPCAADSDGDGVNDCEDKCPDTPANMKVDSRGCEVIEPITVGDVNFDFDKATLKPSGKAVLDEAAMRINRNHNVESIVVIGHTDSVGSDKYNQRLSERRANTVRDYLASQGVSASMITAEGRGEREPVASNDTADGRAQNRRVVIEVNVGR
jgi:OOP family OmpA-OmpF porin